ncbi:uncharacterized protein I206_102733 [Kwoniella pini CBS 10737]|uniref:TPR repeat-containing protein n=1 Tax=Kwoniella pini CBS 10737 TaxID=1296096 RepID=A0A1B9I669_9TREE|nr:uncharacterized protein I206_03088 [Kwoniella pini CBS 10737]OCF51023.1 hypothetical protein I206_03088 [Kwoniella pini CBS 10737]
MSKLASTSVLRTVSAARCMTAPSRQSAVFSCPVRSTPPSIAYTRRWNTTNTESSRQAGSEQPNPGGKPEGPETGEGTSGTGENGKKGLKISWIFSGLAGLGALVTIYGLLEFYSTLKTWPKAVRIPLRAALKAKLRQDYRKSEQYFREALEVALTLGPESLEPEPLQKITGIYVELANVLELMGQRVTAFEELRNALEMFGTNPLEGPGNTIESVDPNIWIGSSYKLNEKDHLRVIGLYQKLGQLSLDISNSRKAPAYKIPALSSKLTLPAGGEVGNWNEASEYYLSNALTAMLRLGLNKPSTEFSNSSKRGSSQEQVILGRDVDLPSGEVSEDMERNQGGSVDKRGLGITMESLSEVYAKKGQHDLSAQLLLQAVSLLLPPGSATTPPVGDRCQAAMLMTTISSYALKQSTPPPGSAKSIKVSKSWSLRSLQLSEEALRESESENYKDSPLASAIAICQRARGVGLYNLGMLAEMEGDLPTALNFFQKSLTASRETGFAEGKREASAGIRRVQSLGGLSTS